VKYFDDEKMVSVAVLSKQLKSRVLPEKWERRMSKEI